MAKPRITLDDNVVVDTEQAAQLLNTPAATLVKWRSTGQHNIPYFRIGRNVRYRTADLRRWIDDHMIGG